MEEPELLDRLYEKKAALEDDLRFTDDLITVVKRSKNLKFILESALENNPVFDRNYVVNCLRILKGCEWRP